MSQDESRSEQVIEAYKRHKLARYALRRARPIVQGFETERAQDLRCARIGIALILLLLLIALFLLLDGEPLVVS
jgi:hypothetical protein